MIYLSMIESEENKRKFVVLYEKYRYLMLKVAVDVLKDYHLAEDAVHEAFIKVAKNMGKVGEINAQETKRYLITITKSATIDIYRKRDRQRKKEIYIEELAESEETYIIQESDIENRILVILRNLPVKYRDIFLLKYSNKLENSEIAELLNISEGNVRQRLARGKKMIQEEIKNLED